jgi:hypothetical protein
MELRSPAEELRDSTASFLPTYRHADLQRGLKAPPSPQAMHHGRPELANQRDLDNGNSATTAHVHAHNNKDYTDGHIRNFSTTSPSTARRPQLPRPLTFPLAPDNNNNRSHPDPESNNKPSNPRARITPAKVPASNSRNGLLEEFWKGPPPAMITQGSYKIDTTSTKDWVASQQHQSLDISPTTGDGLPPPSPAQPLSARSVRSATDSSGSRPLIKPIRGFKTSSRKSAEMAARRISTDQDSTLRTLEGFDLSKRGSNQTEQDEHNSDDSDLFLRAAKEEELARQDSLSRTDSRRVRHHSSFKSYSLHPHYTFLLQVSCPEF